LIVVLGFLYITTQQVSYCCFICVGCYER